MSFSTGSPRARRDVDDGRLPRRVFPRHYNLGLFPDIYSTPEPPFTFSGQVEIFITCNLTANYVVLNAKDLDLTEVAIVADLNSPVGTPSPILSEVYKLRLCTSLHILNVVYILLNTSLLYIIVNECIARRS